MIQAIVYQSNTGYTAEYAALLSKELSVPSYPLSQGQAVQGDVLFLGWVRAGSVVGYKEALKAYRLAAVCAVGMSVDGDKQANEIKEKMGIQVPVFYLPGGFDMNKLHGFNKFLMKVVTGVMGRSLEKKENKTPDEIKSIDMAKHGGSFVSVERLAPVIAWAKGEEA